MRARILPLAFVLLIAPTAAFQGFQLISVEDEIEIGRQAQEQVRAEINELDEAEVEAYIGNLGRQLVEHAAGADYPYSFSVADYREINAFALPGGPIWIYRGTIEAARNEAELVGVLAHEIAHISERHHAGQLTRQMMAGGLLGLLGAILGDEGRGRAAQIGAGVFAHGLFLRFSREHEREADREGARMMHQAGWNPRGLIGFMEVLREQQQRDPSAIEVFLSTHPSPEGRIEDLRTIVADLPGGRTDSPAFGNVQRRLAALPPAPEMPRPQASR